MDYVANKKKTDEIRGLKRPLYDAIEPLLHSNAATIVIQYSHYCALKQPQSGW